MANKQYLAAAFHAKSIIINI